MENYNKRWIAILYYFLDHKDIANGDKIALSVGVSSRTIRNDIKELNTLLVQYVASGWGSRRRIGSACSI